MAFCTKCGHQLVDGAKFCFECGTKVNGSQIPYAEQRKSVYDGEIHRCPNCGDILDAYESVCETCGYERRGTKAASSVQELAQKLEMLEAQRQPPWVASMNTQALKQNSLSQTDEQKVNLIQNFPIPNTKEDIMEFAVWAISNVDPSVFSTMNTSPSNNEAKRAISNAWLTKFEQAYQKGRLMFGSIPELENMYSLYIAKKKSIKTKKNGVWIVRGIVGGVLTILSILSIIAFYRWRWLLFGWL